MKEIYLALAKAKGEVVQPKKEAVNPHFKSKYADLASIEEAIKKPLSSNGLAILVMPEINMDNIRIKTIIVHESGQEIETELVKALVDANNIQKIGAEITYLRRYILSSIMGIAGEEDDDGNSVVPIEEKVEKLATKGQIEFIQKMGQNPKVLEKYSDQYANWTGTFKEAQETIDLLKKEIEGN